MKTLEIPGRIVQVPLWGKQAEVSAMGCSLEIHKGSSLWSWARCTSLSQAYGQFARFTVLVIQISHVVPTPSWLSLTFC